MADLFGQGNAGQDVEKALVSLKKGSQLVKYGRKGKPKLYQFRLSDDESSLLWISSRGERVLKLACVSKIVPGQRTPVFQRYLCPEKDYLSFSLVHDNGQRSLDLICKDKLEVDVWFAGLQSLISSGQSGRSKIDGRSEEGLHFDDTKDLISGVVTDITLGTIQDVGSDNNLSSLPVVTFEDLIYSERPDAKNMQGKGAASDVFRVSISSVPSTSSQSSAQDDSDALGDVYVWGEVISDTSARTSTDRYTDSVSARTDILLPKPLESNVVLDVYHVACGVRHASLVTKHGEVFTWGEESGGRLGHGVVADVIHPRLVESLAIYNVEFVSCGEFHTCAVTAAGELYTWGDGTHNVGLLGNGSDVNHWIPKRVSGPIDGIQVSFVACGTWHTALINSSGQLFTFGDGTFGALGHGSRESALYPREVESLAGLKTIAVACGVWHTAAVVDVIVTQSSSSTSSGKLFTWGDGDKYRLGHGDKEPRLKPTCVPSLIDYNFHKIACGHSLTIGLTNSGRVFTMGSTVYGQLGSQNYDGKLPCLVEDKLSTESVVEVACGSYHVAVLTSKSEVYTWGKGANGRLGHGDIEDRKMPTLVEALKDRLVKHIACGSNFSAAICIHKWVSGAEQSQCAACRQAFGFTRKRHNCYNCGLVHCHSCSSRKALRAALAPNPGKPYRVCDSCFIKLTKVLESSVISSKRNTGPRLSGDSKDKYDRMEPKSLKGAMPNNLDLVNNLDIKAAKQGKKAESLSLIRGPLVPTLFQLKDITFSSALDLNRPRPVLTGTTNSVNHSRAVSPFSRKPSPPRSTTPVPTTSGLSFSKNVTDSLKKTNELLNQEIKTLQAQVETLRNRCELQEFELQKSEKKAQEAASVASEESAKSRAAKEVIKSLTAQLKDMAERLPLGAYENDQMRLVYLPKGIGSHSANISDVDGPAPTGSNVSSRGPSISSTASTDRGLVNEFSSRNLTSEESLAANNVMSRLESRTSMNSIRAEAHLGARGVNGNGLAPSSSNGELGNTSGNLEPPRSSENGSKARSPPLAGSQVEAEWIEQYEPGVYITLVALHDGSRDLKRVRFSRRRFGEQQAETWWSENREKVYEKYNVRCLEKASFKG